MKKMFEHLLANTELLCMNITEGVLNPPAHAARENVLVFSVNFINGKFFGIKPKCGNHKRFQRETSHIPYWF